MHRNEDINVGCRREPRGSCNAAAFLASAPLCYGAIWLTNTLLPADAAGEEQHPGPRGHAEGGAGAADVHLVSNTVIVGMPYHTAAIMLRGSCLTHIVPRFDNKMYIYRNLRCSISNDHHWLCHPDHWRLCLQQIAPGSDNKVALTP